MVCTLNKVVMYSNGLERCTAGLIDTDIVFNATMIGIVDNLIPTDIDARNAVRSPTYATSNLNKVREVIVFLTVGPLSRLPSGKVYLPSMFLPRLFRMTIG